MGSWRLEWTRMLRTRRLLALVATFVILGFGMPVLTYFLPDLIKSGASGLQVTVEQQTAADALRGFAGNVGQLGTLVVAVVAAASVTLDGNVMVARFYRSRIRSSSALVLPRYAVVTATSVVALTLGTLAAAYETRVLFGGFSAGAVAVGLVLQSTWLCFVTAIVVLFASVLRSVVGVVGAAIAVLLALALLGSVLPDASWLPSRLAASGAVLLDHAAGNLWHAVVTTVVAAAAMLAVGVRRLGRREL